MLTRGGMNAIAPRLRQLRTWSRSHRAEIRLCVRLTVSAVLALLLAQLLQLRFGIWAVLTAVLLTQMSVGKSVKASGNYLIGTLGGAILAGAIGALIPHDNSIALAGVHCDGPCGSVPNCFLMRAVSSASGFTASGSPAPASGQSIVRS